ncbi:hypothetical protein [Geothermobacter hydrogeniphilus]|uniref:hypothetical protein n=1 Tax=Geothermobacter hydrogeniphilus TaxID=1969733 RepID=UPI00111C2D3F|nr:hypothetical protein [Geothermobacter hydrogeniphilus]
MAVNHKSIDSTASGISRIIKEIRDVYKIGGIAIIGITIICIAITVICKEYLGTSYMQIAIPLVSILAILFIVINYLSLQIKKITSNIDSISTGINTDININNKLDHNKNNMKFDIPSMLIIHRYDFTKKVDVFSYRSLKIYTIRSLTNEDFIFKTSRKSFGEIKKDKSISDQVDTLVHGIGSYTSVLEKTYSNNYIGKHYINISEAEWETKIGYRPELAQDDTLHRILYKNVLFTKYHDYMGTIIVANTERIRQLIYFPSQQYLPKKLKSIQINNDGEIVNLEPRIEIVSQKNLVIVEVDNLSVGTGFYTYWVWSDEIFSEEPAVSN